MLHIRSREDVERSAVFNLFCQVCGRTKTENDFDAALFCELTTEFVEGVGEIRRCSDNDF